MVGESSKDRTMRITRHVAVLAVILASVLVGCVQVSDQKARTTMLAKPTQEISSFVLLGNEQYAGQIAAAMAKQGFMLRPIAVRADVADLSNPELIRSYSQAGDRYAIQLALQRTRMTCVFSDNYFVNATLTLIDIRDNSIVLVTEQRGPTGECPPLTPVWDLLASEIRTQLSVNP